VTQVMSVDGRVQCKYTAEKRSDRCVSEGHNVKVHNALKRFFKCKDCGQRTTSLNKLPKAACRYVASLSRRYAVLVN